MSRHLASLTADAWTLPRGMQCGLTFEHTDPDANLSRFRRMLELQTTLEQAHGGTLEFEELPNRKSTRIAEYLPEADIAAQEAWGGY